MIYKLKYSTEAAAKTDLLAKGIIKETDKGTQYSEGVHSVVHLGKLVDKPATIVDGKVTIEATYLSGRHVDVLTDNEYTFDNGVELVVNSPKHRFWGV